MSLRSIEFELQTISEANAREHWQARKERRGGQRDTVRAILQRELGHAPATHVLDAKLFTVPNLITVTLTRLAPGTLDDDNLSSAFKAVRDEIAAWCGVDDRDRRLRWQYAQERTAPGIYRVRIEVVDATPGEGVRKVLAGEAERTSGALQRVRPKRASAQALLPAQPSFAVLPWEQPACSVCGAASVVCQTCHGTGGKGLRLAPLARFSRVAEPPARITIPVPAEHAPRYGQTIELTRRATSFKKTGPCWIYEHAKGHRS